MAYADVDDVGISTRRLVSLVLVGLIHVFLGYAIISGLALKAVKVVTGPMDTFEVEEPTVEEEPPPPPPPELEEIPPYVPPPDVVVESLPPPPDPIQTVTTPPPPAPPRVVITPPKPPPPPAPAGPTRGARAKGNRSRITTDDYPSASQRAEEEGTVTVEYTVTSEGRVASGSCTVLRSSGHTRLDEQTCRVIERRFRFDPAVRNGQPITATERQTVTWQLPD